MPLDGSLEGHSMQSACGLSGHLKAWRSSDSCTLTSSEFFAFSASVSNLCSSASVPNSVVVFPGDVCPFRVLIPELYPLKECLVQHVLMKNRSRMKLFQLKRTSINLQHFETHNRTATHSEKKGGERCTWRKNGKLHNSRKLAKRFAVIDGPP